jgi:hypothetical protein
VVFICVGTDYTPLALNPPSAKLMVMKPSPAKTDPTLASDPAPNPISPPSHQAATRRALFRLTDQAGLVHGDSTTIRPFTKTHCGLSALQLDGTFTTTTDAIPITCPACLATL